MNRAPIIIAIGTPPPMYAQIYVTVVLPSLQVLLLSLSLLVLVYNFCSNTNKLGNAIANWYKYVDSLLVLAYWGYCLGSLSTTFQAKYSAKPPLAPMLPTALCLASLHTQLSLLVLAYRCNCIT